MRSPHDHIPIVKALEVAGVEIREKVVVQEARTRNPTLSGSTSVADNDIMAKASTSDPPWSPVSTKVSFSPETSSTRWAFTPGDEDVNPGLTNPIRVARPSVSEPPTPRIADETEWMVCRSLSLVKIQRKKEAKGGVLKMVHRDTLR